MTVRGREKVKVKGAGNKGRQCVRGYLCLGCCLSHSTNKECTDDALCYGEELN